MANQVKYSLKGGVFILIANLFLQNDWGIPFFVQSYLLLVELPFRHLLLLCQIRKKIIGINNFSFLLKFEDKTKKLSLTRLSFHRTIIHK